MFVVNVLVKLTENYLAYSLLSSSSLPLVEVKLKHTITISGPFVKTNVLRGACQNVGFAGQRVIYVNSKVLKVSNNVGGEFPPPSPQRSSGHYLIKLVSLHCLLTIIPIR